MEKKYVLAKDLPNVKRGNIIETLSDSSVFVREDDSLHTLNRSLEKKGNAIKRLLKDGWIEEVKPLEIWVNEYEHKRYGSGYLTKELALEAQDPNCNRTVHFIEAIE